MNSQNQNIQVVTCPDYTTMMSQVSQAQMGSSLVSTAGTLYCQGGRYCFQTALSYRALSQLVEANRSQGTRIDDVTGAVNRPLDKSHVKNIYRYLEGAIKHERAYILPSLTLNFDQGVRIYTVEGDAAARAAVMVAPVGVKMEITDGQHRVEGISKALAEGSDLDSDAIGAMVTFSGDVKQVHQDFADCAKTKAMSQSMLVVFDRRNPANGMALDLVEKCPVFTNTVDAVRQSVSARSLFVWTTNQIRVFFKWALTGGQCSNEVFASNTQQMFGEVGSEPYLEFMAEVYELFNGLARHNGLLGRLASLGREELDEIPKLREQDHSILMTGSGLAVIGAVWFDLRSYLRENPGITKAQLIQRLAEVNWSGDPNNPLFSDNLRINPERMQTGAKYIKKAAAHVLSQICYRSAA